MKQKRVPSNIGFKGWSLLLCGFFLAACVSEAKVPEPDTVFYGTVLHLTDQPLISGTGDVIQVQALVGGVVMASTTLSATTNTYLFLIPLDDGIVPRISGV